MLKINQRFTNKIREKYIISPSKSYDILGEICLDLRDKFCENVKNQETWDGNEITENQPFTIAKKLGAGFTYGGKVMPDIEQEYRFITPRRWIISYIGDRTVRMELDSDAKRIYEKLGRFIIKNYQEFAFNINKSEHWKEAFFDKITEYIKQLLNSK